MLSIVSTWLGVLGARTTNRYDRQLLIRTVEGMILNLKVPDISVQQGEQRGPDAANSRERKLPGEDYKSQATQKATAWPQ